MIAVIIFMARISGVVGNQKDFNPLPWPPQAVRKKHMIDLRMIDELTRKLGESLPPGVSQAREEAEAHFRTVLTGAFERMNLVTREEYDTQVAVLKQTREKLEALEKRLDEALAARSQD
jgi:BMFP domain-containing protein YqiC